MRGLSLAVATVDLPDGTRHEKVTVSARRGTLVIKTGRGRTATTVLESTTVSAVAHVSRKLWELTTGEGTILVKDEGCNCGGG